MRSRQPEKAEATLDEMLARGLQPNVIFFATIVTGWCITGQMDRALKVLDKMRETGVKPSPDIFAILIRGYIQAEMPNEAQKVLDVMEREGLAVDNNCYELLTSGLIRLGYPNDARKVAERARRKQGPIGGGNGAAPARAPVSTGRNVSRASAAKMETPLVSSKIALGGRLSNSLVQFLGCPKASAARMRVGPQIPSPFAWSGLEKVCTNQALKTCPVTTLSSGRSGGVCSRPPSLQSLARSRAMSTRTFAFG